MVFVQLNSHPRLMASKFWDNLG